MVPPTDRASGVWRWTTPLRRLRRRRRRFASLCFLGAGIAVGSAFYLVVTRVHQTFDPHHFPIFAGLVLLIVLLFWLGASAEGEVARIEAEIAELEAEAVRQLERGS